MISRNADGTFSQKKMKTFLNITSMDKYFGLYLGFSFIIALSKFEQVVAF